MEPKIKASLILLLDSIKRCDGEGIAAQMALLDGLLAQGRSQLRPQLVHYLERRSYAKALMFLGGETDIPVGVCGGKK
jgi:hypothetical protein